MNQTTGYAAGLEAAEQACLARAKKHRDEAKKWPGYDDESISACLNDAIEAMECAGAIRALREATVSGASA